MDHSQPSLLNMEGFGSADVTTPFHYGSVHDGRYRNDSLEQKIKKQYWKTKQTVIQKFGKEQDEFIVAGDAAIDTKLEKAYHLQSSCTELLQVIDRYISRLRGVSVQESVMGEHLKTWSETEYTNAGEVMQNVGKLQEQDSKSRLQIVSPLLRIRSEILVFRNSAIRDLNISIQLLEKARTEYRAALLWMRDVSEKLHNPDYRDQLSKFREAQTTVKETKRQFEKLKVDLGEKIDMIAASHCNLLSRSLPNYQQAVLKYSDSIANDFHSLLVDLRTHHHHQYKVQKVVEEIRDLEAEEVFLNDKRENDVLNTKVEKMDDDDESLLDIGDGGMIGGETDNSQVSSKNPEAIHDNPEHLKKQEDVQEPFQRIGDPFSFEHVADQAKLKDLVLGGVEAELRALQNEVLQPREPTTQASSVTKEQGISPDKDTKSQAEREVDDLLELDREFSDNLSLPSTQEQTGEEKQETLSSSGDQIENKWDNFSAFMPATRDNTKSPLSGWEDEIANSQAPPTLIDNILAPLPAQELTPSAAQNPPIIKESHAIPASTGAASHLSSIPTSTGPLPSVSSSASSNGINDNNSVIDGMLSTDTRSVSAESSTELLSKELESLGLSPPTSSTQSWESPVPNIPSGSGLNSFSHTPFYMYQYSGYPTQMAHSGVPPMGMQTSTFRSPLGTTQGPPVFPTQGAMGMGMAPPKFGLISGSMQPALSEKMGPSVGREMSEAKGNEKERKDKGTPWMNFFAHLDPLVNEKV